MKTLLLLRHAKSSWSDPSLDDHARPLNQRGHRDAPRVGELVRTRGMTPDIILSSDAERARVTAQAVAGAAGYAGQIVLDGLLYHASPDQIRAVLRRVRETQAETVMIVGHNPGLEQFVAQLTDEEHDMPTAALAQIVLRLDRWRDLESSTRGTLVGLWRPDELR